MQESLILAPDARHWAQTGHQAWVLPSQSAPRWLGHRHTPCGHHSSLVRERWIFGESWPPEQATTRCLCPPMLAHPFNKKARMNEKTSSSLVWRLHPDPGTAGAPGPWAGAAASWEGRDGPGGLSTCSVPGSVLRDS